MVREARLYLEHQTDGYFNNDMFVKQVNMAVDIFESKYHDTIGLFIFDNAPSHRKKSDDSLNPDHMKVKNGGKQPQMRDTEWNGKVQSMTMDDGQQKGMKQVLIERGVDTKGMNADKMRGELNRFCRLFDDSGGVGYWERAHVFVSSTFSLRAQSN